MIYGNNHRVFYLNWGSASVGVGRNMQISGANRGWVTAVGNDESHSRPYRLHSSMGRGYVFTRKAKSRCGMPAERIRERIRRAMLEKR